MLTARCLGRAALPSGRRLPAYPRRGFGVERSTQLPSSAEVVIIGGGSLGASVAYHLQAKGVQTLMLERHQLTAGTTWHSAGMLWRLRPSYTSIELQSYTREKCIELEAATGFGVWHENGGLFLANSHERLVEYQRLHELGKYYDIESRMVSPEEIQELHPLLSVEGLVGGLFSPTDGTIDPTGVVNAYAREAKRMGAQIAENTGVAGFEHDEQGKIVAVITECGQRVATNRVVNAAGCWAGDVAAKAGVAPLPIVAMKHAMIVTDGVEGMHSGLPNVRDHDLSIYIKTQGDSMALGGYEKNPAFWADVDDNFSFGLFDLDFDTFQQNLEGHLVRCPASAEAGVKSTVCGPESFTPDHQPLLGPDPSLNGLWHCSGFNSMGMMLGGGVGAEMATWMLEGAPSKDLFSMDIARFHPDCTAHRDWVLRSSHESYAKTYAVVFPHDEHLAGRGVRKSPLYDQLLQAGCIFQGRHGFERPGWFSNQQGVEAQEYDWYGAYHEQGEVTGLDIPAPSLRTAHQYKDMVEGECTFNWRASFDAVSREVHAARNGVAVFDQSYFGKFLLTGPDAAAAADWMATAPVGGREVGAVVYTALCNQRGGVQADLTIARDAQDQFYISSGGSTATQDSRWMRSVLHQQGLEACLTDVSDQFAIMSIQGPYSRELLQTMSTPEGSGLLEELPFSHCGEVGFELEKGAVPIRCMRLTFVGELGFELHVPSQLAGEVYSKLMSQGQTLEARLGVPVANAGYHCIDSLSAEKGYRHWHADLSNTDTPMEAGIGFVASNKIKNGPDFLGREALAASKAAGLQRKLVCLTVDAQNPAATGEWELPLNGNETIWRDDVCVGFVRSTAYGHTIGRSVAYGYASLAPDSDTPKITNQWLESGTWHIGSLGQKLPAKLHLKAPFDPTNQRVKGVYEQQPPPESQIRALLDPAPQLLTMQHGGFAVKYQYYKDLKDSF